jgi:hypothetical protein
MSNTTYPVTIDSPAYDPQTTDTLASAQHHVLHGFANDAILALETKLGQGNSVAAASTFLVGIGPNASQWVTTLTAPSITTSLTDVNAKTWIGQTAVASAVNYVNIANAATTGTPAISAQGTDTNIGLNLVPKGSGKVQDNGSNLIDFRDAFNNFVQTGGVWTQTSGLIGGMTALTVWINGAQYLQAAVSNHTFGTSVDTYIDYTAGTGLVYTAVANGAAAPTLAANSVRLTIVVTGASAITSVVQARADSLMNPIYPTSPLLQGSWYSYTPTWTGATTNPVINNGTLAGFYTQVGKTVKARIEVAAGSSTTYGSGLYSWALPVPALALADASAQNVSMPIGNSAILAAFFQPAMVFLATSTTVQVRALDSTAGANPVLVAYTAQISQGNPQTLGTGNQIFLYFEYEAA